MKTNPRAAGEGVLPKKGSAEGLASAQPQTSFLEGRRNAGLFLQSAPMFAFK